MTVRRKEGLQQSVAGFVALRGPWPATVPSDERKYENSIRDIFRPYILWLHSLHRQNL